MKKKRGKKKKVQQYWETVGLITLSIVCAVLGQVFHVSFLGETVAPALFGASLGYLSRQAGVQLPQGGSAGK